ncbi:MAG: bifunctional salicylyl-CoA 5-hydroxylase/oxidoreductase [Acidimicrobiales bacterium]
MDVVCVGGGPGGLLLGILLRRTNPEHRVTVLERNGPDDTFGFGVVFSDEALATLSEADPEVFARIESEFIHWPEVEVHHRGRVLVSGGHGFAALARVRLLQLLSERAAEVGVEVRYHSEVGPGDVDRLRRQHDLVVGCDGVNSLVRRCHEDSFEPAFEQGQSKFIWLGTSKVFPRFTFVIDETEHGVVQAHCYPYSPEMSTFIVETRPETWRAFGFDVTSGRYTRPGDNDGEAIDFAERRFGPVLDGHPIVGNNSKWLEFPTVTNQRWHTGNVVLLGDAAHTAHFSVGSGTKLAMEDAIGLAGALAAYPGDLGEALATYEADRRPAVASLQRAAHASREWFEGIRRYVDLEPERFAFQLLTRSQRITYDNLRLRDDEFSRHILAAFWKDTPEHLRPADPETPPMFYPFEVGGPGGLRLANRVVVSPMAQYSAVDGLPSDWHLVHLGSRAAGGAGLVMTEMVCVSDIGRISPGCAGLWNDEQQAGWARVARFAHEWTTAAIGLQLGHSGRKGSTRVMWEGEDQPLDDGNWPLLAASAIPYSPANQVPREMTRADMDVVAAQFVESARRGAACGFDLLELHMAHGYLLSGFISPLANLRTDEYGGPLERRMRYPLEVLAAVRAVWPAGRPLSVRISATDWLPGGTTGDDAVVIAQLLADHGADLIDVSTGQVDPGQRPRYGRLYQTPFADRIRHEAGVPVMTVGGVASVDDVNTIILAGRADLCLLARPHLVDPYWTLNAAIDQGRTDFPWLPQYLSGRTARRREQPAVAPDRDRDRGLR